MPLIWDTFEFYPVCKINGAVSPSGKVSDVMLNPHMHLALMLRTRGALPPILYTKDIYILVIVSYCVSVILC
jgi:hypothetical protein